jgi:hypothetical protein
MIASCPAKSVAANQSLALELSEPARYKLRLEPVKQGERARAHPGSLVTAERGSWVGSPGVEVAGAFRCLPSSSAVRADRMGLLYNVHYAGLTISPRGVLYAGVLGGTVALVDG